jgi:hypothetical protein
MYDANKIIPGLIIFLVLATFPIWFSLASGKTGYKPKPKPPADQKECIESKAYMKAYHMDLLNKWRDDVVRNGKRYYIAKNKKRHLMSLTLTCMKCHAKKAEFCDQCHNYLGVTPDCWTCHVEPKGVR